MLLKQPCIDTYQKDLSGRWWIKKDPNAELDYGTSWTLYLAKVANDTIVSVQVIADPLLTVGDGATVSPKGLVHPAPSHDGVSVMAWVWGGGAIGGLLPVTFRITTASGRVDDRTIYLRIEDK